MLRSANGSSGCLSRMSWPVTIPLQSVTRSRSRKHLETLGKPGQVPIPIRTGQQVVFCVRGVLSRYRMELKMIDMDRNGPATGPPGTWTLRQPAGGGRPIRWPRSNSTTGTPSRGKKRDWIAQRTGQGIGERGVITMCDKKYCVISTTYRGGHYEST